VEQKTSQSSGDGRGVISRGKARSNILTIREEQARWRIIELLEVGFRPRRVAKLLGIQVAVVYYWQRRFHALGLVGLTTQIRTETPITMRVSVQAMMDVFQLLDNNPLLGHYRVKMALDSLGYRYGHKYPTKSFLTQCG